MKKLKDLLNEALKESPNKKLVGLIESALKSDDDLDKQSLIDMAANSRDNQNSLRVAHRVPITLYKGIGGKGDTPSIAKLTQLEKRARITIVSKDKEQAIKDCKMKSNDWCFLVTVNTPYSGIVIDVELFNEVFNEDIKHKDQFIVDVHQAASIEFTIPDEEK